MDGRVIFEVCPRRQDPAGAAGVPQQYFLPGGKRKEKSRMQGRRVLIWGHKDENTVLV
jgi:hypothetical protein